MNDDQHKELISWLATINNKIESMGQLYNDHARRISHISSILRQIEWILIVIAVVLFWKIIF
jgi:hypothetical protein